ncbi:MAG: 16S rRNA (uracil(1498)-N(3))-methyltransferase [Pseudomonadota bacterium]
MQEIRLYTKQQLEQSVEITLDSNQAHYLANVMRCNVGDLLSLFNGRDGQWQAEITSVSKKSITSVPLKQTRPQISSPDLWLVFSVIKNKSELVVEKATELGVSKIIPLVTRHSVVRSVNLEKLQIHAIEATEQCERLDIPALETHKDLSYLLGSWEKNRILLYGDESGGGIPLPEILGKENPLSRLRGRVREGVAVLIGPEGGFSADEFEMLRTCDFAKGFGMGGRILKADTAAIASLACVQAKLGDWDQKPHFIGKNT